MAATKAKPVAPKGRRFDWEAVERDFRTGKYTLRELETRHGPSYAEISRRSKKQAWIKDLREVIREATNAALLRETVTAAQQGVTKTVLVAAEINMQIIMRQRAGLARLVNVKEKLLAQIEQAANDMPELEDIIDMARKPNEHGQDKLNDQLRKVMSRSGLIDDLKKLSEVDEKVRRGEGEAFKLDNGFADDTTKPTRIELVAL